MRTLEPGRWLSDEAINTYTSCLAITVNEKASTEAVYAYTTFLYSNVITRGYVYTIKWTKAVSSCIWMDESARDRMIGVVRACDLS
jgi:Ulp1 family protease